MTAEGVGPLKRLVALIGAIQIVETAILSSLGPLLPRLADRHDLNRSEVGILVGAYAAGILVGALPGGVLTTRLGARRTVIAGLLGMSVASVGFALGDRILVLEAARFAQGAGAALSWTAGFAWLVGAAPREKRGELIGIAMGAAVGGSLAGPAIGALADRFGLAAAFLGVAAVAALLAVAVALQPDTPGTRQPLSSAWRAVRHPRLAAGLYFYLLPAFVIAGLGVLVPLRLSALGWTAAGIAAISLTGACVQIFWNPMIGRWSDRSRGLGPLHAGLAASVAVSVLFAVPALDRHWPLAALALLGNLFFALPYIPGSALLADGADDAGLEQGLGFALANLAWAPGTVAGSLLAGSIADRAGVGTAHLVLAVPCLLTLVAVRRARRAL